MADHYEEIIEGETLRRAAPGARHEAVCARLHAAVTASLATMTTARLLAPRTLVQLSAGTMLRPDLTLVTAATGKVWLIAEVIESGDNHTDTVMKKTFYEELNLPRLWMVDPRYDNLEVYYGSQYGLALKGILAGREVLTEKLLPQLSLSMHDLFGTKPRSSE